MVYIKKQKNEDQKYEDCITEIKKTSLNNLEEKAISKFEQFI